MTTPTDLGAAEGVENSLRRHRRRHRHEPPRQELGVAGHVGILAQQLPRALDPESPEPAEDLVVDHRHAAGAALLRFAHPFRFRSFVSSGHFVLVR